MAAGRANQASSRADVANLLVSCLLGQQHSWKRERYLPKQEYLPLRKGLNPSNLELLQCASKPSLRVHAVKSLSDPLSRCSWSTSPYSYSVLQPCCTCQIGTSACFNIATNIQLYRYHFGESVQSEEYRQPQISTLHGFKCCMLGPVFWNRMLEIASVRTLAKRSAWTEFTEFMNSGLNASNTHMVHIQCTCLQQPDCWTSQAEHYATLKGSYSP